MRTDNHQVNIRVNEAEYAKIQRVSTILCTFENPSLYEMLT